MVLERTAGIFFCIAITSAIANGQRPSDITGPRQHELGASVSEADYRSGNAAPLRRVQTRSESNGRKVVVETIEGPDIDGRQARLEEVVTETTQGPATRQVKQNVFQITAGGRRRLAETTESRQDTQPNGATSAVHSTWVPDVNGHLRLGSQLIEETRSTADAQRTDTTLLVPGINEPLRETERTESTARKISPEVVRHESTHLVRDVNGRWKPIETRRSEVRELGTSERVEEETIQRPDLNGNVVVAEVNVTRSSRTNDQEQVLIERYAPQADVRDVNGRPPLSERVQRTTTTTADGVRHTVEELEARSPASPNEPMRVVQRIVTTATPTGTDEWVIQRQIFELDANGRLRLARIE